jgi:hypothetical protein
LVAAPVASTGLLSIAIEACLDLKDGSFNRNMPGTIVGLLSQSLDLHYSYKDILHSFVI